MGRTPGADAELAPARRGAGLGSQERCAAGRRQAGPTGSSELEDYIRIPPGNADFSPSALKFLCNELINWNHGAKEVLPSIT